ncbi:MAG: hypothetical protein AB4063_22050 [Crocosphaera sp.]
MEIGQLLGLLTAGIVTVAVAGNVSLPTNGQTDGTNNNIVAQVPTEQTTEETQQPRRLTITVKIAEPEDLKVNLTFHGIFSSRVTFENQMTTFSGFFPFHQLDQ